jgi:hypothetical protein
MPDISIVINEIFPEYREIANDGRALAAAAADVMICASLQNMENAQAMAEAQ